MNTLHPLLTGCLALALSACGPEAGDPARGATAPTTPVSVVAGSSAAPYRFDQPVARFEMPDALREISALTILDADHLGAVQDEDGDLYVLSIETGAVVRVVPFGPPGDYEGIERVGDRLFVLRADGAILDLDGWAGVETQATVYETGLGAKDCDAEGLGARNGQLLIACKEDDGDDLNRVYAFDLATNAIVSTPVLTLDRNAVPGSDKKLRPSALAVHPVTGHTVVLSSRRDALVALDAGAAVADVWDFSPAALPQPEGLAFLPNGDALMSSEGGDGPAVILRFAYQPAP